MKVLFLALFIIVVSQVVSEPFLGSEPWNKFQHGVSQFESRVNDGMQHMSRKLGDFRSDMEGKFHRMKNKVREWAVPMFPVKTTSPQYDRRDKLMMGDQAHRGYRKFLPPSSFAPSHTDSVSTESDEVMSSHFTPSMFNPAATTHWRIPFRQYMTPIHLEWWRGPNICIRREEDPEKRLNDSLITVHFSSCLDNSKQYICTTRLVDHGLERVFRTIFECCGNFKRAKGLGLCEESTIVESLEATVMRLGGDSFLSLARSAGVSEFLREQNITLFLPPKDDVEAFLKRLQISNAVETNLAADEPKRVRKIVKHTLRNDQENEADEETRILASDIDGLIQSVDERREIIVDDDVRDAVLCHASSSSEPMDSLDWIDEQILYSESGSPVRVNKYNSHPEGAVTTANCAKVTSADHEATNGIVHTLDKMLTPVTKTLADMVAADPNLSTLKSLVSKAGLLRQLRDTKEHLTLLAPTDAAFRNLDDKTRATLFQGNSACLTTLMQYHLMPRTVCSAAVFGSVLAPSLLGEPLVLERNGEGKMFVGGGRNILSGGHDSLEETRGAQWIRRDAVATNGVMHIIDAVVVPPSARSLTDVLLEANLTSFLDLLDASGLKQDMNTMTNVTVFAPDNQAIQQLGETAIKRLKDDPARLRDLMLYHVATPQIQACDMDEDQLLTSGLMDKPIRLQVHSHVPLSFNPMGTVATAQCAKLERFDGQACGGVIHVVSKVMTPPEGSLTHLIQKDPELSLFAQILKTSGRMQDFSDMSPLTFLAPTDSALRLLSDLQLSRLQSNPADAEKFVLRHVIHGQICCSSIPRSFWIFPRMHRSLDGNMISLRHDHKNRMYAGERSLVTKCDVSATNGILHKLDQPLISTYPQHRFMPHHQIPVMSDPANVDIRLYGV